MNKFEKPTTDSDGTGQPLNFGERPTADPEAKLKSIVFMDLMKFEDDIKNSPDKELDSNLMKATDSLAKSLNNPKNIALLKDFPINKPKKYPQVFFKDPTLWFDLQITKTAAGFQVEFQKQYLMPGDPSIPPAGLP